MPAFIGSGSSSNDPRFERIQKAYYDMLEEITKSDRDFDFIGSGSTDHDFRKDDIVIVGVGGCGCNTIENLTKVNIEGVKLIAINTDKVHLDGVKAPIKVLIGEDLTDGKGAGGDPLLGKACAEKDEGKIREVIGRAKLVFVTAGMGGGTGTGAAPVVARIAKENGATVIGFVNLPFRNEGKKKLAIAHEGIRQLRRWADTVVLISNDKLLKLAGDKPIREAFEFADWTLATMVKGLAEIIWKRTQINVDMNDVRSLINLGGVAAIGMGESSDPKRRVEEAVKQALQNPLVEIVPDGAKGALVVVYGGENVRLDEFNRAAEIVASKMSKDALIKLGAHTDPSLGDTFRVILLLTGIRSPDFLGPIKDPLRESKRVPSSPVTLPVTPPMPSDGSYDPSEIVADVLGPGYVL